MGAIETAAEWNHSATWNGTAAATCTAPAWGRRRWSKSADFAALSRLPFEFLPNGADPAHLSPPLTYTHFEQALSAVRPSSGPRSAPTPITIFGRGVGVHTDEVRQPSLCRVGENPPTPALLVNASAELVVCLAPRCDCDASGADEPPCCAPRAAPPVAISTNGRDWAGAAAGAMQVVYRYYDAHVVSALGPVSALSGPTRGGTPLTLTGAGFRNAEDVSRATCRFGAVHVAPLELGQFGAVCVTPPGLAGAVHVSISLNGADFLPPRGTDGFTFAYRCDGYTSVSTCTADPRCGWCAPSCYECHVDGTGCTGGAAGPLPCASSSVPCAANCTALSRSQPLFLRSETPALGTARTLHASVGPGEFAIFHVAAAHTNFAYRVSMAYDAAGGPSVYTCRGLPTWGSRCVGHAPLFGSVI